MMLEARGVRKSYDDGKKALAVLKGINLGIDKGSFVALVGPSGAGKSTLLHILGGLDEPTEGKVLIDGQSLAELSDRELSGLRNKHIGFVFQFYHLLPEFDVLENVMMPGLIAGPINRQELKKNAVELLGQVGLDQRMSHFPDQLSGGEKQRVAIVRALSNKPQILLCDEPTGNLDSAASKDVAVLLKDINKRHGTTLVIVTHNEELAKTADRIYHLSDGVLVN